jgi:hypothetical protein
MSQREALDRTLRLMRDDIDDTASDEALIDALTGTVVAIVADADNLATHSAQTTCVTAALLMARSGHRVHVLAPDVPLLGAQPPLASGSLIAGLMEVGRDLLPGVTFSTETPTGDIDLAVAVGDSSVPVRANQHISLNCDNWSGTIAGAAKTTRWSGGDWPMGAMAAGAMAATEAFKVAMRKLNAHARNPAMLAEMFAPAVDVTFRLARPETCCVSDLHEFDCVSGGAITQALLYVLARLPGMTGATRVIEPDRADMSNLNRYMLLRLRSARLNAQKAGDIAATYGATGLVVEPVARRFEGDGTLALRPVVLVGVDDIPSRWHVQRARPEWLGIGATTHWSAMASFHASGAGGCAQCLHPLDDPSDAPIATVAFVSFWAGLLTATYFLRHRSGELSEAALDQQIYVTPLRPETPIWATVPPRVDCLTCAGVPSVSLDAR